MSDDTVTPPDKPEPYVINLDGAFWSSAGDYEQEILPGGKTPENQHETSLSKKAGFDVEAAGSDPYNTRYEILSKASTQSLDDSFDYGGLPSLIDEIIEPLYNMERLTVLNDISVVRAKCVEAMMKYTVGLGYVIKKIDPHAETQDSDRVSELIRKQLEKWAARDEKTFTELMEAVKQDEETTGNGFLEVSRNRLGQIDGLYHVPAYTVRIRRDRTGYIQQRGMKKVPFYRFGDKVLLSTNNTIQFVENRDPKVNELIHFKIQNSRSPFYGSPRDVAAIVTIAGDEMARNHNIKFFSHSATPELALVFTVDAQSMPGIGGDQPIKVNIPEQTKRQIAEHFRRNLSTAYFEPGLFFLPNGVKLDIKKLSEGQKDSGWTKYRQENRDEVRMAFRTPPVIIGDSSGAGYATAAVEKQVYQEGVIGPEQERYQNRLMGMLWPELVMITPDLIPPTIEDDGSLAPPAKIKPVDGSGVDSDIWKLCFKAMSIADKAVEAANHMIYGQLQTITKNEIRADIGRRPMEGGDVPPPILRGRMAGTNGQSAPGQATPASPNAVAEGDISGLGGRPGGGRGANGTVSAPMPRRMGDIPGQAANASTVGNPMAKREADSVEEVFVLIEKVHDDPDDMQSFEELQEIVAENPELLAQVEAEYMAKVDDAFAATMRSLHQGETNH